ncbi:hypothetical protein PROFUN_11582 [Planoprotostelium fungivorum]|uniref:MYND-type domain-containing protein n=1 Tax=Planoprotostelium fungivorum TaxID=1890364 RepID=A0A2P6N9U8_9EUKA|nr:hypothetical protein PROFUN_11582 [Planoprotostelium fungivorum]
MSSVKTSILDEDGKRLLPRYLPPNYKTAARLELFPYIQPEAIEVFFLLINTPLVHLIPLGFPRRAHKSWRAFVAGKHIEGAMAAALCAIMDESIELDLSTFVEHLQFNEYHTSNGLCSVFYSYFITENSGRNTADEAEAISDQHCQQIFDAILSVMIQSRVQDAVPQYIPEIITFLRSHLESPIIRSSWIERLCDIDAIERLTFFLTARECEDIALPNRIMTTARLILAVVEVRPSAFQDVTFLPLLLKHVSLYEDNREFVSVTADIMRLRMREEMKGVLFFSVKSSVKTFAILMWWIDRVASFFDTRFGVPRGVPIKPQRVCATCGKVGVKSKECQLAHWKEHKRECKSESDATQNKENRHTADSDKNSNARLMQSNTNADWSVTEELDAEQRRLLTQYLPSDYKTASHSKLAPHIKVVCNDRIHPPDNFRQLYEQMNPARPLQQRFEATTVTRLLMSFRKRQTSQRSQTLHRFVNGVPRDPSCGKRQHKDSCGTFQVERPKVFLPPHFQEWGGHSLTQIPIPAHFGSPTPPRHVTPIAVNRCLISYRGMSKQYRDILGQHSRLLFNATLSVLEESRHNEIIFPCFASIVNFLRPYLDDGETSCLQQLCDVNAFERITFSLDQSLKMSLKIRPEILLNTVRLALAMVEVCPHIVTNKRFLYHMSIQIAELADGSTRDELTQLIADIVRHRLRVDDDDLTVTLGRSLQVVTGELMARPIKNGRFPSYTRSICEMVHEAALHPAVWKSFTEFVRSAGMTNACWLLTPNIIQCRADFNSMLGLLLLLLRKIHGSCASLQLESKDLENVFSALLSSKVPLKLRLDLIELLHLVTTNHETSFIAAAANISQPSLLDYAKEVKPQRVCATCGKVGVKSKRDTAAESVKWVTGRNTRESVEATRRIEREDLHLHHVHKELDDRDHYGLDVYDVEFRNAKDKKLTPLMRWTDTV